MAARELGDIVQRSEYYCVSRQLKPGVGHAIQFVDAQDARECGTRAAEFGKCSLGCQAIEQFSRESFTSISTLVPLVHLISPHPLGA